MDQQLSSAAQNLENVICKGLGLNPKPGSSMLRAIKLRTLKDAVQHPFPEVKGKEHSQELTGSAARPWASAVERTPARPF